MQYLEQILKFHPQPEGIDGREIAELIAMLSECAYSCRACADACLAEPMVKDLRSCISTDMACAQVCDTVGALLTRRTAPDTGLLKKAVEMCVTACGACAEDCEAHAEKHAHCKHCGKICRECEKACLRLAAAL